MNYPLLAASFLILVGGAPGERDSAPQDTYNLSPKPVAGEAWHREFQAKHLLGLDSLTRRVGDEAPERIQTRMRLSAENSLRFADRVATVSEGRIQKFRREVLESQVAASQDHLVEGAPLNEVTLQGGITGLRSVYTWVDSEQDYGRYYEGPEARESWLASLPADLPGEVLLPPTPVKLDQTWPIDPLKLRAVLAPGGAPQYQGVKGMERVLTRTLQMGVGGSLYHGIRGRVNGKASCRLVGIQELEGQRVAQVELTIDDVRLLSDITEFSLQNKLKREQEGGVDTTSGKQLVEISGTGTLLWNLDAGRMVSFRFGGREAFRTEIQVVGTGGSYTEIVQLSGRLEIVFSSTPLEEQASQPTVDPRVGR